jgi:hypothetical protein
MCQSLRSSPLSNILSNATNGFFHTPAETHDCHRLVAIVPLAQGAAGIRASYHRLAEIGIASAGNSDRLSSPDPTR